MVPSPYSWNYQPLPTPPTSDSISNIAPLPLILPLRPCSPFVPLCGVTTSYVTTPAFDWCPSRAFLCLDRPSPVMPPKWIIHRLLVRPRAQAHCRHTQYHTCVPPSPKVQICPASYEPLCIRGRHHSARFHPFQLSSAPHNAHTKHLSV
jgi:hypothetical protein